MSIKSISNTICLSFQAARYNPKTKQKTLICCDVVFPVNQCSNDGVHMGTLFITHSTLELIYKDNPDYFRNILF